MLLVDVILFFVKNSGVYFCLLVWNSHSQETEDLLNLHTEKVSALIGKSAILPCDITPNTPEERIYMVLWFRSNWGKPLYTYDVRGRSFGKALHWSDPNAFDQRATFITDRQSAALLIKEVVLEDHGLYRCRVDFKNSPTRNTQISLTVVVPPHKLLLFMKDPTGENKAVSGMVGPLLEGQSFTIYCEVRGGRPKPTVSWYHNNKTVLDVGHIEADDVTQLTYINMTNALRTWHDSVLRCQASNTHLDSPYERKATIKMHLSPISTTIINKTRVVLDDHEYILACISCGSQPPAEITWYRDNEAFPEFLYRESRTNDTCTISRAALRPTPDKDGQTIRCRAENQHLSTILEDWYQIEVRHKPVVNLTLGHNINENYVKEGDDIYFECHIKSNPKEFRVNWYYNDVPVVHNPSAGVVIADSSLILREVSRAHIGLYSCKVTNMIGATTSQQVYLRIQYAPVCAMNTSIVIGAMLDEVSYLSCTVDSDPPPQNFTWVFNNTMESFVVSSHRYGPTIVISMQRTMSQLHYRTSTDRDYGTLHCYATNAVRRQSQPCILNIIRAVKPAAVRRCKYYKITRPGQTPMLAIRCFVGYDGAKLQHFTLETTGKPRKLLVNTSYVVAMFVWLNVTLADLEDVPNDQTLMVTAHNAVGSSASYIIKGIVFNDKEKYSGKAAEKPVLMALDLYILPITAASLGVLVLVALAVAYSVYKCRRRAEMVTSTVPMNKPPTQSAVQVDSNGRTRMFAYPANDPEVKPDILLPKPDNAPPRVVLESSGNAYAIREVREEPTTRADAVCAGYLTIRDFLTSQADYAEVTIRKTERVNFDQKHSNL